MKRSGYLITVFVISQLLICASITLWVIWYVYEKNTQRTFFQMAQQVKDNIEYSSGGYSTMVGGILILSFILISTILIFIELVSARSRIKSGMDFSSAFTHDLMTPLTCINMNLESVIERKSLSDDEREELMKAAFNESNKLKESFVKIFEVKRIEHGRRFLKTLPAAVNAFFEDYVAKKAKEYPESSLQFISTVSDDKSFKIDQRYFTMVFDNLLENSLKYCKRSPEIYISVHGHKKRCIIEFKDNGIGIDDKLTKQIFKIFFRVNHNIRGNGMGLYIVKSILKHHKAQIKASSLGENKGTLFTIKIPMKSVEDHG